MSEENNQLYYYHGDHLGSAQLVTDPEGKIYEQLEYTPYGELWVEHLKTTIETTPFRFTGKERDSETGLYYFGARYLNPQTSMWLSADPAMGEYIPAAPINDEAKQHNKELPGLGGVFNYVNLHTYHYAGNNPVVLMDPDGENFYNFTKKDIVVFDEDTHIIIVRPGEMYEGPIDGVMLEGGITKVTFKRSIWISNLDVSIETTDDGDTAFLLGGSGVYNALGDLYKKFKYPDKLPSGIYTPEGVKKNSDFDGWIENYEKWKAGDTTVQGDSSKVRKIKTIDTFFVGTQIHSELEQRE
jgi:RHS repeat-associated protein